MAIPSHVTVTAPEGRKTPVHPRDGVDVAGRQLFVEHGVIRRVAWSVETRRSWRRGDLLLCTTDGAIVQSPEAAASDHQLEGGQISIASSSVKKKGT